MPKISMEQLAQALDEAFDLTPPNDKGNPAADPNSDEYWAVGGDGYLQEIQGESMTTKNWLESARCLMAELSQQPFEVQQAMRELSRRDYSTSEDDFQRMCVLEGSLSASHIQQIRSQSNNFSDYLANLERELQASNEAIAQVNAFRPLEAPTVSGNLVNDPKFANILAAPEDRKPE
jgi:hypothetical protein